MQRKFKKSLLLLIAVSIHTSHQLECQVQNCKDCLEQKGPYCQICKKGYFLMAFKNSGGRYNKCWELWKAYIIVGILSLIILTIGVLICRKIKKNSNKKISKLKKKMGNLKNVKKNVKRSKEKIIGNKKIKDEERKKDITTAVPEDDTTIIKLSQYQNNALKFQPELKNHQKKNFPQKKILRSSIMPSTQFTTSRTIIQRPPIIISNPNPVAKIIFSARKIPPKVIRRYFRDDSVKEKTIQKSNGDFVKIVEYDQNSSIRSLERFKQILDPNRITIERQLTSPLKKYEKQFCFNSPTQIQNLNVQEERNSHYNHSRRRFTTPRKNFYDEKRNFFTKQKSFKKRDLFDRDHNKTFFIGNTEVRSRTKIFKNGEIENKVTFKKIPFEGEKFIKKKLLNSEKHIKLVPYINSGRSSVMSKSLNFENSRRKKFFSLRKNNVKKRISIAPRTLRKRLEEEIEESLTLDPEKKNFEEKKDLPGVKQDSRDKLNRRLSDFRLLSNFRKKSKKKIRKKTSMEFDSLNPSMPSLNHSKFLAKSVLVESRRMRKFSPSKTKKDIIFLKKATLLCPVLSPGPLEINKPALNLN